MAQQGPAEQSLKLLSAVPAALQRGASWGLTYCLTACAAASVLWLIGCTDYIDVIESSLLEKVPAPDFRYPLRDARLSMARLSALQGRYEEMPQWFTKTRAVLTEEGFRPLLAIADYDEGLAYLRHGAAGDKLRALPLVDASIRQFRALGMPGWIQRAEKCRASI
jgi:hypothetical protein